MMFPLCAANANINITKNWRISFWSLTFYANNWDFICRMSELVLLSAELKALVSSACIRSEVIEEGGVSSLTNLRLDEHQHIVKMNCLRRCGFHISIITESDCSQTAPHLNWSPLRSHWSRNIMKIIQNTEYVIVAAVTVNNRSQTENDQYSKCGGMLIKWLNETNPKNECMHKRSDV